MKALILAAGFGKRMAPVTEVMPKPLLPVAGIPVIRRNIEKLTRLGICEIVINLHHFPELIRKNLSDIKDVSLTFSEEKKILGTGGGIKKAIDFLGGEDFLIINSDVLSDINYQSLIDFHLKKGAACTLALRKDKEVEQYGAVEVDFEGRVRRFLGKGFSEIYKKYMYTGIQIMSPSFLKNIRKEVFCDLSKEVYPEKVYAEGELFGFVTEGYWEDVGKPSSLLDANRHFLDLFSKKSVFTAQHEFRNQSIIHKTSEIAGSASTISYSFVGKNVTIEEGAVVHNSIIMNDARIKKGSFLKGSIIGPGTILDSGTTYERLVAANVLNKIKINQF